MTQIASLFGGLGKGFGSQLGIPGAASKAAGALASENPWAAIGANMGTILGKWTGMPQLGKNLGLREAVGGTEGVYKTPALQRRGATSLIPIPPQGEEAPVIPPIKETPLPPPSDLPPEGKWWEKVKKIAKKAPQVSMTRTPPPAIPSAPTQEYKGPGAKRRYSGEGAKETFLSTAPVERISTQKGKGIMLTPQEEEAALAMARSGRSQDEIYQLIVNLRKLKAGVY